jgi:thiol-disulfide isomerase/thioredoxin
MWVQAAFLVLFFVIAYRFWKTRPKREVKPDSARLYFFFTEWCGHSKRAMPEWQKIEASLASSPTFGRTKVEAIGVDADKDPKTSSLYEINGYPTLKLETVNGIYDFNQAITEENVLTFLRETLGKEPHTL